MSVQELFEGLRIVDTNRRSGRFLGPRDIALIDTAEAAIGSAFPPTYREFVQRLGAGYFAGFEFYGITDGNFEASEVPNGIWLTLNEHRAGMVPANLLIIADAGDGAYYCIELRNGQEGPVIIYESGIPADKQHPEKVANDFGEFFLAQVRQQLQHQ